MRAARTASKLVWYYLLVVSGSASSRPVTHACPTVIAHTAIVLCAGRRRDSGWARLPSRLRETDRQAQDRAGIPTFCPFARMADPSPSGQYGHHGKCSLHINRPPGL